VNINDISQLLDFGHSLLNTGVHTIPPVAMECVLSEVEPSVLTCCNGQWSQEANRFFTELVKDKNFYAQVYSVVNSVMSLRLFENPRTLSTVNDVLIHQRYAQPSEESYLSKVR
jgi:hypothetical protein